MKAAVALGVRAVVVGAPDRKTPSKSNPRLKLSRVFSLAQRRALAHCQNQHDCVILGQASGTAHKLDFRLVKTVVIRGR